MSTFICKRIFKDDDTLQLASDYVIVDTYRKGEACKMARNVDPTYETEGMTVVSIEIIAEDPPKVDEWDLCHEQ